MCPPEWYGVDYVINPWMAGNLHRSSRDLAFAQWKGFHNVLRGVADVRLLHPERGCPDMVFLGHAALSFTTAPLPSPASTHVAATARRDRPPPRTGSSPTASSLWETPGETAFEGEGDITFNDAGTELWAAHGVRTCQAPPTPTSPTHGTCRCILCTSQTHASITSTPASPHCNSGYLLYYPGAFDTASSCRHRTLPTPNPSASPSPKPTLPAWPAVL